MLLEIDQVAIDPALTKDQLREKLDGITLNLHAFGGPEQSHWEVKTIRELEDAGIISHVVIFTGRDAVYDPLPAAEVQEIAKCAVARVVADVLQEAVTVEGRALKEIYRRIDAVLETTLPRDVTVVLRQILPKGYKHSFHK
jgi:hypothetical protein